MQVKALKRDPGGKLRGVRRHHRTEENMEHRPGTQDNNNNDSRPLIIGLGGTIRPGSSTDACCEPSRKKSNWQAAAA